ncbi:MAG TPA: adenylosuccinate synthase [Kofleriaceae bacterium]|nr:adenylosuccinate synthase [Kofleriaceae bacterium]
MSTVVVVGAQWGDEGKGKVVDLFSERADMVVRYGGGANAGHTLVIGGTKLVTHLVPSGVMHPGKSCVLGDGMVIDPHTLLEEIADCQKQGLLQRNELLIGLGAHVILPYHKLLDGLREDRHAGTAQAIGTTRRGIGPAYEAKAGRRGVKMRDLLRIERLRELVRNNLDELNPLITHLGGTVPSAAEVEKWVSDAARAGEKLAPSLGDASRHVYAAIVAKKPILFEGAQGCLLDLDHGTYPYVTSSSTIAAGACQSAGIGPTHINAVIGITKAYATRVGSGPFPTEMHGEFGERLRQAGGEFGATTGRPRRCGWLDLAALRMGVRLSGMTGLALTKLDVLSNMGDVQVCVGYKLDGKALDEPPIDGEDIARAEPIFQTFPGWGELPRATQSLDDLPKTARDYVQTIAKLAGAPLALVSVGPDRNQTIKLADPFAG